MVNFYHCFIPAASNNMRPLFAAIVGKPKDTILWSEAMVEAFNRTKNALANATMLSHLREGAETSITVDTSDTAVGGVL